MAPTTHGSSPVDTLTHFYIRISEACVLSWERRPDKPGEVFEVSRDAPRATIEIIVMSPLPGALMKKIPEFQAVFRVRSMREDPDACDPFSMSAKDPYTEIRFRIMDASPVPGAALRYRMRLAPLPDAKVKAGGQVAEGDGRSDRSSFLALIDDAESRSPVRAAGSARRHFSQEIEEINFRDPATGETGIAIKNAAYAPLKMVCLADILAAIPNDFEGTLLPDMPPPPLDVDAAFDAMCVGDSEMAEQLPIVYAQEAEIEVDLSDLGEEDPAEGFEEKVATYRSQVPPDFFETDQTPVPAPITAFEVAAAPPLSEVRRPSYWTERVESAPRRILPCNEPAAPTGPLVGPDGRPLHLVFE